MKKHTTTIITRIKLGFTIAIVVLLSLNTAKGQWSTDKYSNTIIASNNAMNYFPNSISDGDSGFLIAWSFFDTEKRQEITKIKKVSATGYTLWGGDGIQITNSTRNQGVPHMLEDGKGGVIITWFDYDGDIFEYQNADVYAQHIDNNGKLLWGDGGVIVNNSQGSQYFPTIATDNAGGAIITWSDNEQKSIYAQRINAEGKIQWAINGVKVSNTLTDKVFGSNIISEVNGNYSILWSTKSLNDKINALYFQKINLNGQKQFASQVKLSDLPDNYNYQQLVTDGSGGLYGTIVHQTNTSTSLHLQKFSVLGVPEFSGAYGITVDDNIIKSNYSYNTCLLSDDSGGVVIGWADKRTNLTSYYLQRFNKSGGKLFNTNDVTIFNNLNITKNMIIGTSDFNGSFVFIASLNYNSEIYAQSVNNKGTIMWEGNGELISEANHYDNINFFIALSKNNTKALKMLVLWEKNDYTTPSSIVAQPLYYNNITPINLNAFTALHSDNKIRLNWNTASETNNQGFDIERSIDGTIFSKIGFVNGNGTTNVPQTYTHNDADLNLSTQYLYYRLKQIDTDGAFEYSDIISVKIPQLNSPTFSIYPNPITGNQFNIKLESLPKGTYQVNISNMAGVRINKTSLNYNGGSFNQVIPADLPKGIYILEISSTLYHQTQKLVVE